MMNDRVRPSQCHWIEKWPKCQLKDDRIQFQEADTIAFFYQVLHCAELVSSTPFLPSCSRIQAGQATWTKIGTRKSTFKIAFTAFNNTNFAQRRPEVW